MCSGAKIILIIHCPHTRCGAKFVIFGSKSGGIYIFAMAKGEGLAQSPLVTPMVRMSGGQGSKERDR